jgi:lysozyme
MIAKIISKILALFERKPMYPMIDDATIIQRLMLNEGVRNKAYYCPAGKLTIGIGRNLDDNPLTEEEIAVIGHNCRGKCITNEQAAYLCRNNIAQVKAQLDRELPWWRTLDIDRQFVMIDLCFNMGIKKLLTFQKTLNSIATGYYIIAGEQLMQSKYAKQVGVRARRNAYALKTGEWVANPPKEV